MASSAHELRRRDRAQVLKNEGRWTEAAAEWEILVLLRPDRGEYRRELGEAKSHIEQQVSERLQFASQARRRGETERAQLLYLKVLSLDPANAIAAQALREIDAERTRRSRFNGPAARPYGDKTPRAKGAMETSGDGPAAGA
jgi:tetratricopeptide (TPR) repeat protein